MPDATTLWERLKRYLNVTPISEPKPPAPPSFEPKLTAAEPAFPRMTDRPIVEDLPRMQIVRTEVTEADIVASMCEYHVSPADPQLSNLRDLLIQLSGVIRLREACDYRTLALKRLADCWNSLKETHPNGWNSTDHRYDASYPPDKYAVVKISR